MCCQEEISATSSLAQRSPTNCGASFCVIHKPQEWVDHAPWWVSGPQERKVRKGLTNVIKKKLNLIAIGTILKNTSRYMNCNWLLEYSRKYLQLIGRLITGMVAVRCKAFVFGQTVLDFVGSSPLMGWIFFCCSTCVLSCRGFCDELITRSEESYRLWWVVCEPQTSTLRRPWPVLCSSATGIQVRKVPTNINLEKLNWIAEDIILITKWLYGNCNWLLQYPSK